MRRRNYTNQHGGYTDVQVYSSVSEWIGYLKTIERFDTHRSGRRSRWAGDSLHTACRDMIDGVASHKTKRAKELIDKIDAHFSDRHKYKRVHSYVGARVHVGKMLGGSPKCVVRRKRMSDDFAPIKLVMEVQVSAGVSDEALEARGAALAALATVMAKERPVELWMAFAIGQNRPDSYNACGMVRVSTTPLSLSQAVALFATNAVARRLSFMDGCSRLGASWTGGWAFGSDPSNEARMQLFRDALQLKPQDVFVPGGHLTQHDLMMRDPVAWVNAQLEKQRGNA